MKMGRLPLVTCIGCCSHRASAESMAAQNSVGMSVYSAPVCGVKKSLSGTLHSSTPSSLPGSSADSISSVKSYKHRPINNDDIKTRPIETKKRRCSANHNKRQRKPHLVLSSAPCRSNMRRVHPPQQNGVRPCFPYTSGVRRVHHRRTRQQRPRALGRNAAEAAVEHGEASPNQDHIRAACLPSAAPWSVARLALRRLAQRCGSTLNVLLLLLLGGGGLNFR